MSRHFAGRLGRMILVLAIAPTLGFVLTAAPSSAQVSRPVSCRAAQSLFGFAVNRWMNSPDGSPAKAYWDAQASYWESYLDDC